MYSVSQFGGGTLLYQAFPALDLVDASEARFLTSAVRDAVREARGHGRAARTGNGLRTISHLNTKESMATIETETPRFRSAVTAAV